MRALQGWLGFLSGLLLLYLFSGVAPAAPAASTAPTASIGLLLAVDGKQPAMTHRAELVSNFLTERKQQVNLPPYILPVSVLHFDVDGEREQLQKLGVMPRQALLLGVVQLDAQSHRPLRLRAHHDRIGDANWQRAADTCMHEATSALLLSRLPAQKKSWLGLGLDEVNVELAQKLGLMPHQGARIAYLFKNGPGERAGLRVGDVVLAVDGKRFEGINGFQNLTRSLPPGQRVRLEVLRADKRVTLSLRVEAVPAQ
jgi:hypothetical protein